ncbi:MAG: C2 family cysteine protease, partial [Cyanobacteriota bacterium]
MEAKKITFDSLDGQDIQVAGTATSAAYGLPDSKTSLQALAIPIELDSQGSGQIKAGLISNALSSLYAPETLIPVPSLPSQADPITGSSKHSLASLNDPIIGSAIFPATGPLGETPDIAANTSTSATISVGGSSTGVVGTLGDRDWFRIALIGGLTYRFNLNGNTLSDPTLYLRNASGISLAFNDNFSGLNSQITFTATTSGTYYLDAGGFLSSQGSYSISFLDTTPSSDRISGLFDANLRSNINIALQDNLFSLSELANLLRITGNDGTVSAVEFADLRTINTNLSSWINPSTNSYYSYIFDAVVNGNTANQWWTAGGGTRTTLGNLQAGSSALQLNRLVDKWFGGLDLPTNFVGGDTASSAGGLTFSYSTATGNLFQNGISFSDIAQGQAGTCYLLAAASSLANNQSGLISDLFRDNGDGTFGVRFYSSSRNEFWVTVNRALPTVGGSLALAGNSARSLNGELWVALLEKAYAQANETGLFGRSITANSYRYVEGGWEDALTHLSGATTASVSAYYSSANWQSAINNLTTWNSLRSNAIAAFNAGRSLWVGSFGNTTGSNGKTNLVSGHAFAVTGFNAATGNFILANPWGSSASSWNHQFEVTWQQLFNARAVVSWDNGNPPISSV